VLDTLLPLTPFEEYMLCDDSSEHPGCFFLRFKLSGPCHRDSLNAALASAVARHPLLSATVIEGQRGQLKWNPVADHVPGILWQDPSAVAGLFDCPQLDLREQPGLAVLGCETSSGMELLFQFHHSACDGIGALQFIEDFFHNYDDAFQRNGSRNAQQVVRRRIDPQHLVARGNFGLTRWQLLKKIRRQAVSLYGIRDFLTRTPTKLISSERQAMASEELRLFPRSLTHTFSTAETNSLLAEAHASGTTLNNLLIRDLLLAICDFRTAERGGEKQQWVRLSIPMNLRRSNCSNLSATNMVSMVFVDRQSNDLCDTRAALDGIHRQMQQIKDLELGLTFPLSLKLSRWLPGGKKRLRRMSSDTRCRCTAVLSNLMRPLNDVALPRREGKIVVGDCMLDEIEFLPPVRQGTQASFGVATYADRLNVAMHYDSRCISGDEAQELLNRFNEYLRNSAIRAKQIEAGEPLVFSS
jgi:NRPS condensation-like uncharacterized protein